MRKQAVNSMRQIVETVADVCGVPVPEIVGRGRHAPATVARRVISAIAYKQGYSTRLIGRSIRRSRATVTSMCWTATFHAEEYDLVARSEMLLAEMPLSAKELFDPPPPVHAPPAPPRVLVKDIIRAVAEAAGMPEAEVTGRSRKRDRIACRRAVCLIAKAEGISLSRTARVLGGRDHTTTRSLVRRGQRCPHALELALRAQRVLRGEPADAPVVVVAAAPPPQPVVAPQSMAPPSETVTVTASGYVNARGEIVVTSL